MHMFRDWGEEGKVGQERSLGRAFFLWHAKLIRLILGCSAITAFPKLAIPEIRLQTCSWLVRLGSLTKPSEEDLRNGALPYT